MPQVIPTSADIRQCLRIGNSSFGRAHGGGYKTALRFCVRLHILMLHVSFCFAFACWMLCTTPSNHRQNFCLRPFLTSQSCRFLSFSGKQGLALLHLFQTLLSTANAHHRSLPPCSSCVQLPTVSICLQLVLSMHETCPSVARPSGATHQCMKPVSVWRVQAEPLITTNLKPPSILGIPLARQQPSLPSLPAPCSHGRWIGWLSACIALLGEEALGDVVLAEGAHM
jgi:hypothetical protein